MDIHDVCGYAILTMPVFVPSSAKAVLMRHITSIVSKSTRVINGSSRSRRLIRVLFTGSFIAVMHTGVPAHADTITHAEARITNVSIIPQNGSLIWDTTPWLAIAATGAFDNRSGWQQDFSQNYGDTFASSRTAFVSATSTVSTGPMQINVVSGTSGQPPLTTYSYGELYNTFQVAGSDPLEVSFSLEYSAFIWGQTTDGQFAVSYGVEMLISDGVTDWVIGDSKRLGGDGYQEFSITDRLTQSLILQPGRLYSIDIITDPSGTGGSRVPLPGTMPLTLLGLAALWAVKRKAA